jgi:hypothetical protein
VNGPRARIGRALRGSGLLHEHTDGFGEPQRKQLDELATALARIEGRLDQPAANILEEYCRDVPSPQTAVDIFAGEWASALPVAGLRAGSADLFAAPHVPWGVAALGGVAGQRVLELGPLEGGHTYLLDRMGAAEVVAVEANTRAYLKCLVVKELVGIPAARFHCGDAVGYLADHLARGREPFDLLLASGILYHLQDPVAALDLMTRVSDRLVLWTMYMDEPYVRSRPDLSVKFPGSTEADYDGFAYRIYRQEYQHALDYRGFCGGSAASSAWLTRADILRAVEHFGFEVVDIGHEEQDHKGNGACFCIAARRRV